MTEVAGHASSVGDRPDHVRLSRIEVDMQAGAPGEAPERRHPSTHRLCGGKQIQHLPETTAGAPGVEKGFWRTLAVWWGMKAPDWWAKVLGLDFWVAPPFPLVPPGKLGQHD